MIIDGMRATDRTVALVLAFYAAFNRRDWAGVRLFALAGIACVIATLINPLGWRIYEGSAATVGHFVQAYIGEWESYYRNMSMPESSTSLRCGISSFQFF